MSQRNFTSPFNTTNLVALEGKVYERLSAEDQKYTLHKYRVILGYDDYDYVEDELLIAKLDREERL